jgi:hypothetical protein
LGDDLHPEDEKALSSSLQFPTLFRWWNPSHAFSRHSRNRSRCFSGKGDRACPSPQEDFPYVLQGGVGSPLF